MTATLVPTRIEPTPVERPVHLPLTPVVPSQERPRSAWAPLSLGGLLLFLLGFGALCAGHVSLAPAIIAGFVLSAAAHVGNKWTTPKRGTRHFGPSLRNKDFT
jgi:hypothetical protein